jgi:hypothetical protein
MPRIAVSLKFEDATPTPVLGEYVPADGSPRDTSRTGSSSASDGRSQTPSTRSRRSVSSRDAGLVGAGCFAEPDGVIGGPGERVEWMPRAGTLARVNSSLARADSGALPERVSTLS